MRAGAAALSCCAMAAAATATPSVLTAAAAAACDAELFSAHPLPALVEVAGLAVATCVHRVYPPATHPRVLVLAGPGNNGADGMAAARHLSHFGYASVVVVAPRHADKHALAAAALRQVGVAVLDDLPPELQPGAAGGSGGTAGYSLAVDAVFGFSFVCGAAGGGGGVRPPYDRLLAALRGLAELVPEHGDAPRAPNASHAVLSAHAEGAPPAVSVARSVRRPGGGGIPVVAVDVPSGWDVDAGDVAPPERGGGLRPSLLVSLTAPKPCALAFDGPHHWLGGRFLSP
jgi:NAD(P)H-hydrate epimerase